MPTKTSKAACLAGFITYFIHTNKLSPLIPNPAKYGFMAPTIHLFAPNAYKATCFPSLSSATSSALTCSRQSPFFVLKLACHAPSPDGSSATSPLQPLFVTHVPVLPLNEVFIQ